MTRLVQLDLAGFFIKGVVAFLNNNLFFIDTLGLFFDLTLEGGNQGIDALIELGAVLGLARNDQWRTRFINQDGVHFIHHGKM